MIDAFNEIQQAIIAKLIELARDNEVDELKTDDLNEYAILLLQYYLKRISGSLIQTYENAEKEINQHILEQWGIEVAHDHDMQQSATYLNNNIILALIGSPNKKSKLMMMYEDIVNKAREADDYQKELQKQLDVQLERGLRSNYSVMQNGIEVVWMLDRYVNQIEKHIYHDTYNKALDKAVEETGTELVWVDSFASPRDACADLQASGTICIVPRSVARPENLQYPNIWDSHHMYMHPGGHSGINCRHLWHARPSAVVRNLYKALDTSTAKMYEYRVQIRKIIRRDN